MENLRTDDFDFDLDESLIAQFPLEDRASSRLLVANRDSFELEHRTFRDIVDYIKEGEVLVINDTKVIPARLFGNRLGKDEAIEVLLLKKHEGNIWETLVKPGKKMKIGTKILFGNGKLEGEVIDISDDGERFIKFSFDGIFEEILDELGTMPLPPYIHEKLKDKDRYQTVYAKHKGSAAAPTAGLHFTKELLEKLKEKGVKIAKVTLHVGLGTFRPVKVENVKEHKMHEEYYEVSQQACDIINEAKKNGKRIFAVGTTSIRTLESVYKRFGKVVSCKGNTDIFIYPGFKFGVVDCLITNFHLPKSTLVMLVSAFASKDIIMNAYKVATKERYRFFSFGDAMLIKREEKKC
ncbi:hypothetical protein HMPREF3188_00620 [Tissierellia bacterium KA00581]|jgi:hypothetical protein|nr:hypothetical protein HMPREF3188_00620 [Tissierellia bacterium KA00581]